MLNTNTDLVRVYTPDQIAQMLQLSKNTVYELINRGEIVAKKIGKVYRIPAVSIAFIFTGLDYDLYQMDQKDQKLLPQIEKALKEVRSQLK